MLSAHKNMEADIHEASDTKLLRVLGAAFGIAIVIGGMIGVGILRTPGIVAANVGSAWGIALIWILGGIYTLCAANSYAELGSAFPESGGPYVFVKKAFGRFAGFVAGWSDWFLNTAACSYLAVATAEYAVMLFRSDESLIPIVAVILVLMIGGLHVLGVRAGAGAQKLVSLFKVLGFAVLIGACFILGGEDGAAAGVGTVTPITSPILSFAAVIISMQAVIETYAGYNAVVYFGEEQTDPGRNVPRALFLGVALVTLIYLLVNLALLYTLPIGTIAASKLPAADAARVIFGETGMTVITALSFLSLLGILNANIMQTPRVLFALSRDRLFAEGGATVNSGGTPSVALFATVGVAVVLALTGTFESLLAISAFMGVSVDTAAFASLIVLRKKLPDLPRPFPAIGFPVIPAVIVAVSILLLVAYFLANTTPSLIGIAAMFAAYPGYVLLNKRSAGSPN